MHREAEGVHVLGVGVSVKVKATYCIHVGVNIQASAPSPAQHPHRTSTARHRDQHRVEGLTHRSNTGLPEVFDDPPPAEEVMCM